MTSINVSGLHLRRKGGFELGPVDVTIGAGAKVAMLGPSGCGKTTLLRCIAGLETPDAGEIRFGDEIVQDDRTSVPPGARRIGFVFQDAALWPHLDTVQHLRFVDPDLTLADAAALLEQVGLMGSTGRRPGTLSGGEAQRLALARGLAGNPTALLLDEPLNAVDVPMRDELSMLVHRLCDERALTLIVVTHDRREALAMADELVILCAGRVVETGPAARILREPQTAYAATFVGDAACLPALRRSDGSIETPLGQFPADGKQSGEARLVVLPGDLVLANGDASAAHGRVLRVVPSGDGLVATVDLAGHTLRFPCPSDTTPGAILPLALRGAPRILPSGGPA